MSPEISSCRLCLTTEGSMEGIFTSADTQLTRKIFECTSVMVKNLAGLPSFICEICKSELIIWLKFRRQCLKTNEILKTKFPNLFEEKPQYETSKLKRAVATNKVESIERLNSQDDANDGDSNEADADDGEAVDGDANIGDASEPDDNIPLLQLKEEPCQVYEEVHYVTQEQSDENESSSEERTILMEIEPQPIEKENVSKRRLARKSTVTDGVPQKRKNKNGESVKVVYPNRTCYITKCKICGKAQQNMKQHMRIHLDERPYKCPYCERAFRQRGNYTRHVNIHTGAKPYKCKECESAFADPASLRAHIVRHTGERAYHCEICGKSYGHSHVLAAHKRIHTQDRRHPCNLCDKRFLSNHALTKHIRTHTGERPYQCEKCEKSFTTSGNLTTHQRVHTREKPFDCSICKMSFAYRSVLKTHMKIHKDKQPITETEEEISFVVETLKDIDDDNTNDIRDDETNYCEDEYEIYLNSSDEDREEDFYV